MSQQNYYNKQAMNIDKQVIDTDEKDSPDLQFQGDKRFDFKRIRAKTLQGRIYDAYDKLKKKPVVIKETWKQLVQLKLSRDNHPVPEDFVAEKAMMKYLSQQSDAYDYAFVKLLDEWEDKNCYYVAMDACLGGELFTYVKQMHTKGAMSDFAKKQQPLHQHPMKKANSWVRAVRAIFIQMVKAVWWFHQKGVCHLDLSLENTMIDSRKDGTIKIIDFGLAKKWNKNKMKGRVGKIGYMAPEVYGREEYDPCKADVWSLGVMLFMMLIGAPPYDFPRLSNPAFKYIINGKILDILKHWKRVRLATDSSLKLLNSIFKYEKERCTMDDILDSEFVGLKQWRQNWLKAKKQNELKLTLQLKKKKENNINHANNSIQKLEEFHSSNDETDSESDYEMEDINTIQFGTPKAKNYQSKVINAGCDGKKLMNILKLVELDYNDTICRQTQGTKESGSINTTQIRKSIGELDRITKIIQYKMDSIEPQPTSHNRDMVHGARHHIN